MKVINLTESTLFLDDANLAILYSRDKRPFDIDDKVARKSRNLKWAIQAGMLVDVTSGVPDVLPKPRCMAEFVKDEPIIPGPPLQATGKGPPAEQPGQDAETEYDRKREFLSRDEPRLGPPKQPQIQKTTTNGSALEDYKKDGSMSIMWTGPATDAGGYASCNREFMFGLEKRGVKINYDNLTSMNDLDSERMARIKKMAMTTVPSDAPKVYGMTAPLIYAWERYKMLFTMMETRYLHKDYVSRCDSADEIIVPSHWCKSVFLESGVKKPIHVVPLGVDTRMYRPDVEPIDFSIDLKDYVFLSVFGWSMRKGYDVLLKAYLEEFTSDDPVSLLISSRFFGSTDDIKKQRIRDDVALVSSTVRNPKKPHLVLFGDCLPVDMMPRLYAAADCYVLPTRGEGFCLPGIEAGACGLPVIMTRYSGQTDFLDDDNSYLIDVDGFYKAKQEMAWISYFYEDQEFPILGPKAVEQLRHMMRRAYENREEAAEKARKLYHKVVTEYDWETCINKMHDKLKQTFGELSAK